MVTLLQPALPALPRAVPQRGARAAPHAAREWLAADVVGHLVPTESFEGRVHSSFEQACNIRCGDMLLALVRRGAGNGPTALHLIGTVHDLRTLFAAGEPVHCRRGVILAARAAVDLSRARVWWPAPPRTRLPTELLAARLQRASQCVAQQRARRRGMVDTITRPEVAALIDACRAADGAQAARCASRLVGLGEGLTPAGDDFLLGLCAGLDAWPADAACAALRHAIAGAIIVALPRTTSISAHQLSLATLGHYGERLLDAREALLSDVPWHGAEEPLRAACSVGASSGCDTMAGLLAALSARLPAAVLECRA